VRRGSIVQLVAIGVLCGAGAAAVALLIPWLPDPASKQADRIDFVFWFVTAISIVIFALVAAVIIYALINFRARPDEDEDGPPIHGHTGLEIAWTAIPFVLVTAMAIVCGIVLSRNDAQGANPLVINVQAQQFAFTFSYPDANNATSPVLRLPVNRSVVLHMRSLDVIHAFWVPEFREQMDIVPGMVTELHITPDRMGTYPLICNELCGLGHGVMRTQAIVMSDKAYNAWIAQQKAGAST
jgi:cytochrome c oxidase subunit II